MKKFICFKIFDTIALLILLLIIFTCQSTSANSLYNKNKIARSNKNMNLAIDDQDYFINNNHQLNDYYENDDNLIGLNNRASDRDDDRYYKSLADVLMGRDSNGSIREKKNMRLRDLLQQKSKKRGFQIQTYFDALVQKDGSILLIPKDVNKNHYFIG
jgi:hypothetical protein